MTTKILTIVLPEYNLNRRPNYLKIGQKVDTLIEKNLSDGEYLYRAIGKDDHPHLSLDKLINIILQLGTDKYDFQRKEVCFEEFSGYDHDIQAGFFKIKNHKIILDNSYEYPSLFGDTIKNFYENALLDRGFKVRIDILMIYDAKKLVRARKTNHKKKSVNSELEKCLYKFKNPQQKRDALVAIVKILR